MQGSFGVLARMINNTHNALPAHKDNEARYVLAGMARLLPSLSKKHSLNHLCAALLLYLDVSVKLDVIKKCLHGSSDKLRIFLPLLTL